MVLIIVLLNAAALVQSTYSLRVFCFKLRKTLLERFRLIDPNGNLTFASDVIFVLNLFN